ncbi:MAG: aldose 1-epimerase family protein [Parabacteroides distasonis]|nr:aldose 1-epimerase family protein [Parabacteroides distasonis]
METIKNSILSIQVAEHGAELQSIQKDGKEYLWQGDAKFWGRRSPVLFPTVGRVWNNVYRHEGISYDMGQHGFARDMDFQLVSKEEDKIEYVLESTPETLAKYPFPFRLHIGYELVENQVIVKWRVENIGERELYFQIGAHPAFYFPNFNPTTFDRCFFAFDKTEALQYICPVEKGCASPEIHTLELNKEGLMPIDIHSFDCDTYIFENKQLKKITLLDKAKAPYLSLAFDTPLVAIWSPTKEHPDCPFICIEPWYGRCDTVGYEGEFKEKDWMQTLAPGAVFEASYQIIIEA